MILTVRMKNPSYYMRKAYASYVEVREYNDYTGAVLPNPKWLANHCFCLSSGTGKYDFRILEKENIIHGWLHK